MLLFLKSERLCLHTHVYTLFILHMYVGGEDRGERMGSVRKKSNDC